MAMVTTAFFQENPDQYLRPETIRYKFQKANKDRLEKRL